MIKKVTNNARAHELKPRITRSDALLEVIFDRIANGESLNRICSTEDMPSRKSFYEWVREDEEVLRSYKLAMSLRANFCFDEILDIADDVNLITSEEIARAKLRIDARKWAVSKLAPKKYGGAAALDLRNDDKNITVEIVDFSNTQHDKSYLNLKKIVPPDLR